MDRAQRAAQAELIRREQGGGFPLYRERLPRNQLGDAPTDIPTGERACAPHAGVSAQNEPTLGEEGSRNHLRPP